MWGPVLGGGGTRGGLDFRLAASRRPAGREFGLRPVSHRGIGHAAIQNAQRAQCV
jgi:hypothetical protein